MATILESFNDSQDDIVYTTREKKLMHQLRGLLKDSPDEQVRTLNTLVEEDRGERWSNAQLLIYLQQAVSDINATPPVTQLSINNFPEFMEGTVVLGGFLFALMSETVNQVGETFSYSDNGISLNVNLAQGYQGAAQALLQSYNDQKKELKKSLRPKAAGIKTGNPAVKIRSYAPRQWVYR